MRKKNRAHSLLVWLLVFFLNLFFLGGCGGSDSADTMGSSSNGGTSLPTTTETTPALPPDSSLTFLSSTLAKAGPVNQPETATKIHFNLSALTVSFWTFVSTSVLTVPSAVFQAATSQTPTYQGDLTWLWTYSQIVGNVTYRAELTGVLDLAAMKVAWTMKISSDDVNNPLTDFEWYNGVSFFSDLSSKSALSGYWVLYDPERSSQANEVIRIDWTRTNSTTGRVKVTDKRLTVNDVTNDKKEDYAQWEIVNSAASFTFYDNSMDQTTFITWTVNNDGTAGEGSITYPAGSKGCWDSDHNDRSCP